MHNILQLSHWWMVRTIKKSFYFVLYKLEWMHLLPWRVFIELRNTVFSLFCSCILQPSNISVFDQLQHVCLWQTRPRVKMVPLIFMPSFYIVLFIRMGLFFLYLYQISTWSPQLLPAQTPTKQNLYFFSSEAL